MSVKGEEGSHRGKWMEESGNERGRNGQINVRTEEECIVCVGGTDDGYKMCEDP